jgi:hypothetical protein
MEMWQGLLKPSLLVLVKSWSNSSELILLKIAAARQIVRPRMRQIVIYNIGGATRLKTTAIPAAVTL